MATRLMSFGDAAQQAGISIRTLQRMIARGEGPRQTRIAARVLISEADLDAWIAQMAEQPRAA